MEFAGFQLFGWGKSRKRGEEEGGFDVWEWPKYPGTFTSDFLYRLYCVRLYRLQAQVQGCPGKVAQVLPAVGPAGRRHNGEQV